MQLQGLLGILAIGAFAWAISEKRRAVPWRMVVAAFALQVAIALLLLRLPAARAVFLLLNRVMHALMEALDAGTSFVFGYVGGAEPPFEVVEPARNYVFAIQSLPFIILIGALAAVLFHWRVLPAVVKAMSAVLQRTTGIGGAAGLGVCANVFLGMVESPLLIAPYIRKMNRGELFVLMTSGMATVAGTVMVLYATILADVIPSSLGHLLSASLINAPASVVVAALMVPPVGETTPGELRPSYQARSTIDALSHGGQQGVRIALNVAALLIVMVAVVSLANQTLALLPAVAGAPLTLQRALGFLLSPLAWLIGIPWSETTTAGGLFGTKIVLNELIAYSDLAALPEGALGARSRLIMSYAMCGFANFASLGILIGGVGTVVPERRAEITEMGLKCIVSGTLATCLTGAIVAVVAAV